MYRTFFRSYDPATARFLGADPLAAKYAEQSPYGFAFNAPANYNDPSGADPMLFINGRHANLHINNGASGGATITWMGVKLRPPASKRV
ncbi:MAG: hypothetical protein H7Z21_15275 [Hymenobacter sp.]|nr:hypothetical protein [Hymenobacter sp.]